MRQKRCKVMYGRDHLADLWLLDDGRWQLQPTETHVPIDLVSIARFFDPYVGPAMPPLVREWLRHYGISDLPPLDPIASLLRLSVPVTVGIRFEREGR